MCLKQVSFLLQILADICHLAQDFDTDSTPLSVLLMALKLFEISLASENQH